MPLEKFLFISIYFYLFQHIFKSRACPYLLLSLLIYSIMFFL